jgi:hypothetical protein
MARVVMCTWSTSSENSLGAKFASGLDLLWPQINSTGLSSGA